MAEAVEVCCWQCSEYHMNFPHVLNIIVELKKKKISANFNNILSRITAEDEINDIQDENLERLLQYACEYNYISKSNYKKNVSYRVNGNVAGECDICTNILVPFLPEIIDIVS